MTTVAGPYTWSPYEETTVIELVPVRPRVGRAATLFALGVLALLLLVVPGVVNELDGQSMVQVTQSIVARGDVTVAPPLDGTLFGVPGLHGQWYSKYGPAQSLLAVPLYLAGRALAPLVPAFYRPELPILAASLLPALATALTAALLVLAAVELGASLGGALVLATVYIFATPAVVYATEWFSEPLTACATLAATYLLLRDRSTPAPWRPLVAGVALSIAVATRLDALVFVPLLALYIVVTQEDRIARLVSLLLPLGVTLVGLGFYNAARFGSPFETGYGRGNIYDIRDTHPPHTLRSFADGLFGLLLSPGKGLAEYAPVTLLAPLGAVLLWLRRRAETALLLSLFLADLVAHANILIRWVGGWSWGPRFLMPGLPFLLLLLAPLLGPGAFAAPVRWGQRLARGALLVLSVAGVAVQVPALIIHEPWIYIYDLRPRYCYHVQQCPERATEQMENDYIYRPALSPIIGSWTLLFDGRTWTPATPDAVAPTRVAHHSVTVAPHTWWRLLSLQGVPTLPLLLVCLVLLVAGLAGLLGAARVARGAAMAMAP